MQGELIVVVSFLCVLSNLIHPPALSNQHFHQGTTTTMIQATFVTFFCVLSIISIAVLLREVKSATTLLLERNGSPSRSLNQIIDNGNDSTTPKPTSSLNCSRNASLLTSIMKTDLEFYGLRAWSSPKESNKTRIIFPGLDEDLLATSFRGKRIVLLGDSTLRNMNMWLHQLLTTEDVETLQSLSALNLSEANDLLVNYTWKKCEMQSHGRRELQCARTQKIPETKLDDGTEISFVWGPQFKEDECPDTESSSEYIKSLRPQIIVANMGLWWLHFQSKGRNQKGCVAETWMNYEQWLNKTLVLAKEAGSSELIFKTTNFICDEKYTNRYARANHLYRKSDEATIQECFNSIRDSASVTTSNEDILDYCHHGTINNIGSKHLNERLFKFIDVVRETTSLKLSVLNDFEIQSCKYTSIKDGRHYQLLNLARIRLLGNLISCNQP